MTSRLNPYISFNGDARQALEFYHSVFGGSLSLKTFGEFGMEDTPAATKIMHGQLEADNDFTLMCADTAPGMEYVPGNTMSVSLSGDDADLLRGYWDKLTAGGTVAFPLEKQMWGDEFGQGTDKFGINWMVNISQSA